MYYKSDPYVKKWSFHFLAFFLYYLSKEILFMVAKITINK